MGPTSHLGTGTRTFLFLPLWWQVKAVEALLGPVSIVFVCQIINTSVIGTVINTVINTVGHAYLSGCEWLFCVSI